jgi:hypothetical protein
LDGVVCVTPHVYAAVQDGAKESSETVGGEAVTVRGEAVTVRGEAVTVRGEAAKPWEEKQQP